MISVIVHHLFNGRVGPKYEVEYKSRLDSVEYMDTSIEAGYKNMSAVQFIRDYLEISAMIGHEGDGRLPTFRRDDPSASTYGYKVANEIQNWIKDVGPLTAEELPFTDFTVSPLTTLLKPNGRVRLILDSSIPH